MLLLMLQWCLDKWELISEMKILKGNRYFWLAIFLIVLVGTNLLNHFFWPVRADDQVADETLPVIKYEPGKNTFDPELIIFWEALDSLTKNYIYPLEIEQLIEGAVQGMIHSVDDPQVRYYDKKRLDDFLAETRGTYGGIGVRIIEANGYITVFETFRDSPAERGGMTPGDRIVKADGNDLVGQGIDRAVELLRGPSNTPVEVTIKRPGSDEPIIITVYREEIVVTTVFSEMLEDGLGYIKVGSFDSNTAREFAYEFRHLSEHGLRKGLILDLRNNPGGLVEQAVRIGEQLVPEGEIVRLIGRNDEVRSIYHSSAAKKPYPIVVLINEESASAAELLAGALQDRDAALLVGKTTYGKASVQQLEYLSGGTAMLLTVAKYFTPSGHDIDKNGIIPDFEVDMPEVLRYYRYFHPGRLEPGNYGPDVEILQLMLQQIGFSLEATGYYDDQTSHTISLFQGTAELERSGEFDDLTWISLREALDLASREQDLQLIKALEVIKDPDLWVEIEGNR